MTKTEWNKIMEEIDECCAGINYEVDKNIAPDPDPDAPEIELSFDED